MNPPYRNLQGKTKLKRSAYVFFYLIDGRTLDVSRLLQGSAALAPAKYVLAASLLKGVEYALTFDDLRFLFGIPSDEWTPVEQLEVAVGGNYERLEDFAEKGLVITDASDPPLIEMRSKEEKLSADQWNVYSALYHMMSKWKDVRALPDPRGDEELLMNISEFGGESLTRFVQSFGEPPDPFFQVPNATARQDLPIITRNDGVFASLAKRCTTRAFNPDRPMTLEQLSLLLYYVYGCHGYARAAGDLIAIKKTSPSGGGLHPTEVYPLVRNVSGVAPGLYHYDIKNHSLELIEELSQGEGADLANEFTAGQLYPRRASVLFIMTARFFRNHWKYRKNPKTYGVILMDAAHLSQSLYLVAADLGLGAFVTAAINSVNIESRLGLDGCRESPIAICGAGIPADDRFDPEFHPYTPRATIL